MSEQERQELLEAIGGIKGETFITISEKELCKAMSRAISKEIEEIEEVAKKEGGVASTALSLALIVSNASATKRAWKMLTEQKEESA